MFYFLPHINDFCKRSNGLAEQIGVRACANEDQGVIRVVRMGRISGGRPSEPQYPAIP